MKGEMKGVKHLQNCIQLALFSKKQWDNMIIAINLDTIDLD